MTWADYTILAVILASALLGLLRGFLRETASLLLWILGFWLAARYAVAVGDAFRFVKSVEYRLIVGYAVILVAILVASTVAGMLLQKLVESSGAGAGDRSLGTLFGAARGVVVVTVLILVGSQALSPLPRWWRESKLIPYAAPLLNVTRRLVPVQDLQVLQPAPILDPG